MAGHLPENPSQQGIARGVTSMCMPEEAPSSVRKWYFSRQEIEDHSPSRKDGIDLKRESELRKLYCDFLQDLGITLKVPQVTIASGMMLCHRFYMRQSHAKNDWQTIATVSMFLVCKIEETPRLLKDVVVVAYEMIYKGDPSAPQRIRQREVYDKQKQLILVGERLLLSTIAFDFNIQLPYKPLVTALKTLKLCPDLAKVAWNFVNDWLRTTLCLQYKPHYIAAASMFLAAKFRKVKLPTEKGKVWWLEFDISPKQLEEVIQQMLRFLEQDRKQSLPTAHGRITQSRVLVAKAVVSSPQSCMKGGSTAYCHSSHRTLVEAGGAMTNCGQNLAKGSTCVTEKETLPSQTSDSGSASSVVEDGDGDIEPKTGESGQNSSYNIVSVHTNHNKIDTTRIREVFKRRRGDKAENKKFVEAIKSEIDSEAWIEKELENGIELQHSSAEKKRRKKL